MSKFNIIANHNPVGSGWPVFRQITLSQGFSSLVKGNKITVRTMHTLTGLCLLAGLTGILSQ
jgi:hypothetical protein